MDLKDFIKETIKDISGAISESNHELSNLGTVVNPKNVDIVNSVKTEDLYGHILKSDEELDYRRPVHLISFDIAVSSTKKENGKEGIGVNVVGIKLAKDGAKANENNTNSRLRFSIPIALPTGEK